MTKKKPAKPLQEEDTQVPSSDADISMRGVELFEQVAALSDLNKLIRDAVWNELYKRNANIDTSRGAFVEPLKRSSEEAHYAVHVAIDGKHAIVHVTVPRSELELHEQIATAGLTGLDLLLAEY